MTLHQALDAEDMVESHPFFVDVPSTVAFNKLRKRLVRQTREAIEQFAMAETRRPLVGCALRRQGFLRPAGDPARSEMARPVAGRTTRLQPRPGTAEFSKTHPARVLDPAWHRPSHRVPRHLFGGHRQDRRGQHLLFALLAATARSPLSHCARGGMFVAGARAPPRRHSRNLLHEPLPRRPSGGDAAEASQR